MWAASCALWKGHSQKLSVALLVALAVAVMLPWLTARVGWTTDGLFYQAQMYQLQGESQPEALHREFTSAAAREIPGLFENWKWIRAMAPNYRRRWVVPALAAALAPLVGNGRSLLDVSIIGYVLIGPLLFALLRKRFSTGVSLAVAAACLLVPPLRQWAPHPLTDSWGVTVELAALIAAVCALERGRRWIPVWVMSMLVLSFTRDNTLALITGMALVALVTSTRRSVVILTTGVAASIPAVVLFGAPLARQLSYALNNFRLLAHPGWSYVISRYPGAIVHVLHLDLLYPDSLHHRSLWYAVAVAVIAAFAYFFVAAPRREPLFLLARGGIIGAAGIVALAANFTGMRLELAFLPCVAIGVAFTLQRLWDSFATAFAVSWRAVRSHPAAHRPPPLS